MPVHGFTPEGARSRLQMATLLTLSARERHYVICQMLSRDFAVKIKTMSGQVMRLKAHPATSMSSLYLEFLELFTGTRDLSRAFLLYFQGKLVSGDSTLGGMLIHSKISIIELSAMELPSAEIPRLIVGCDTHDHPSFTLVSWFFQYKRAHYTSTLFRESTRLPGIIINEPTIRVNESLVHEYADVKGKLSFAVSPFAKISTNKYGLVVTDYAGLCYSITLNNITQWHPLDVGRDLIMGCCVNVTVPSLAYLPRKELNLLVLAGTTYENVTQLIADLLECDKETIKVFFFDHSADHIVRDPYVLHYCFVKFLSLPL